MERLRKVLGNETISAANLDFHYWLALAHEAAGAAGRGRSALYKKIQAEDPAASRRPQARRAARGRSASRGPGAARARGRLAPAAAAHKPAPAASPASVPASASRPQRFVPKEQIANGPLGAIFRGEDATDGRNVAMRMLNPALLEVAAGPGRRRGRT